MTEFSKQTQPPKNEIEQSILIDITDMDGAQINALQWLDVANKYINAKMAELEEVGISTEEAETRYQDHIDVLTMLGEKFSEYDDGAVTLLSNMEQMASNGVAEQLPNYKVSHGMQLQAMVDSMRVFEANEAGVPDPLEQ